MKKLKHLFLILSLSGFLFTGALTQLAAQDEPPPETATEETVAGSQDPASVEEGAAAQGQDAEETGNAEAQVAQVPEESTAAPAEPEAELGFFSQVGTKADNFAGVLNNAIGAVLFYSHPKYFPFPFIVLWLVMGALILTLVMKFINFRAFKHALQVVRGKYDNPNETGEVTHFQALSAALSATVGLGNIAGVAIAVMLGGPGATFWMIVAGLLGMTTKFTECTLGQMYRKVDENGVVSGGPMHYLADALKEKGMGGLGKVLAILFAILCIGASFGGGNMFQVVQSKGAIANTFPFLADPNWQWIYGLVMAVLVGIVIIGGIKRIAHTTEKIVPFMCGIYVLAALVVLGMHIDKIPAAFTQIVVEAFSPKAAYGGFIGVLVMGFRRAAFSNEAGVGSAAIAHSAARTEEPVREGIVALLEPFIDTVVVCTITALVIVITGAYENTGAAYEAARGATDGAMLTSLAFQENISWFPYILSLAVFLFAFSTMISWSYYGERCWTNLFGDRSSLIYKLIFLVFAFLGAIISPLNILNFSDTMILAMSLPNILGLYIMAPKVRAALDKYMGKLAAGEFKTFK